MSNKKMGCIPRIILVGGVGIAALAFISYVIDQVNPGAGAVLWDGLGQLALDLLQMVKEALSS